MSQVVRGASDDCICRKGERLTIDGAAFISFQLPSGQITRNTGGLSLMFLVPAPEHWDNEPCVGVDTLTLQMLFSPGADRDRLLFARCSLVQDG